MTRPTCLDCGQVVDVRAGYHDCPGSKAVPDIHAIEDTVSRSELDNEHEAHRRTAQSAAALRRERDAARRAQDAIAKRAVEAIDEWHAKFDAAETRLADLERFLRGDVRAYVAGSRRIPGMTLLDRIDAALSAPAQPATAAKACATCGYQGHCIYHDAAPPSTAAPVNDGYFTCPVCKGIGSHGDECQWLQEHYPAAPTLGDELHKHERYLNREINYDERHAPAAREATKDRPLCDACGCWVSQHDRSGCNGCNRPRGSGCHRMDTYWTKPAVISSNHHLCPECKQPVGFPGVLHMLPCSRAPGAK